MSSNFLQNTLRQISLPKHRLQTSIYSPNLPNASNGVSNGEAIRKVELLRLRTRTLTVPDSCKQYNTSRCLHDMIYSIKHN